MSRASRRTWSKEQLEETIKDSFCLGEVLKKLNLSYGTNNYASMNKAIKEYDLDISHFVKGGKNRTISRYEKTLEEILIEGSYLSSNKLKKRLLKEGLLENKCSICGLDSWLDKKIVCQLDHINGVHDDNRIENLRMLCPNCHSQTETFCRKKTKGY